VRVGGAPIGRIGPGLLLLVGFTAPDGPEQVEWMADKVVGLRVFADDEGRMNRSLDEAGGDLLVVSQFTLFGDVRKGRRPSFVRAAPPEQAVRLYEAFVDALRTRVRGAVHTGEFGALMEVDSVNDGPVTLVIDRE
jgi:D-tyrosyl-tRNA(Tyr) deacylase